MPAPWRGYDRCQGPCVLHLIEHGTNSPHARLGFDVASDVIESGKPYPGMGAHVQDEFFEDAHAQAILNCCGSQRKGARLVVMSSARPRLMLMLQNSGL
jgi:hypothetical protein